MSWGWDITLNIGPGHKWDPDLPLSWEQLFLAPRSPSPSMHQTGLYSPKWSLAPANNSWKGPNSNMFFFSQTCDPEIKISIPSYASKWIPLKVRQLHTFPVLEKEEKKKNQNVAQGAKCSPLVGSKGIEWWVTQAKTALGQSPNGPGLKSVICTQFLY